MHNILKLALSSIGDMKTIQDGKKRIYELSRELPEDKGYELIRIFEEVTKAQTNIMSKGIKEGVFKK